jgi:hypothetical protein
VLGLEDLVRWIRSAPGESQYVTTGFAQYDCQARRCVSACCLGSVLSVMLEDDRTPVVLGLVDREFDDDLTWISGIAPVGMADDWHVHGLRGQFAARLRLSGDGWCRPHPGGPSLCQTTPMDLVHGRPRRDFH